MSWLSEDPWSIAEKQFFTVIPMNSYPELNENDEENLCGYIFSSKSYKAMNPNYHIPSVSAGTVPSKLKNAESCL